MSYVDDIQKVGHLTINEIIRISNLYVPDIFKSCPYKYRDSQGRTLNHGTAVLETEEQCCVYMSAYGPMHHHKLMRALDEHEFPYSDLSDGVEIYDWGCGQAIGTMAVIEKLRQHGMLGKLRKVVLEEPSDIARNRAILHVKKYWESIMLKLLPFLNICHLIMETIVIVLLPFMWSSQLLSIYSLTYLILKL